MVRVTQRKANHGKRNDYFTLPPWLWALLGILLGFFIAKQFLQSSPTPTSRKGSTSIPPKIAATNRESNNGAQYDFYTLLPKSEVIANAAIKNTINPTQLFSSPPTDTYLKDKTPAKAKTTTAAPITSQQKSANYLLQVASSRSLSEATKMGQNLRDLGLIVQIKAVKDSQQATWYRIQVGPYSAGSELERARDLLKAKQLKPLLIKIR